MLTKRACDAATYEGEGNRRYVLWDSGPGALQGFGLRIYPTGRKAWVLSYRAGATKRLATLGTYGVLTVEQARKRARALLVGVETEGADPVKDKREHRATEAATGTLAELLASYAATLTNPRTAADARQSFGKNVLPYLGTTKARDVTEDDIGAALDRVLDRGARVVARNLFVFLHAAFEHGLRDRKARRMLDGKRNAKVVTLVARQ